MVTVCFTQGQEDVGVVMNYKRKDHPYFTIEEHLN